MYNINFMVGFELKALILILLFISIIINVKTYEEVWVDKKEWLFGEIEISEGWAPRKSFWYLLTTSIVLFIYALYLNEQPPVILF